MHGRRLLSPFLTSSVRPSVIFLLALALSCFPKGREVFKPREEFRSKKEGREVVAKRPSESNHRTIPKKTEAPRIEKKSEPRRPKPDFNEVVPGKKDALTTPEKPPEKPPKKTETPKPQPKEPPTWTKPFKPGF